MKYIELHYHIDDLSFIEEAIQNLEEVDSIIVKGLEGFEVEGSSILELKFHRWALRGNLSNNVDEKKVLDIVESFLNKDKIVSLTIKEDNTDYMLIKEQRNIIEISDFVVVNTIEDFNKIKLGNQLKAENNLDNKLNTVIEKGLYPIMISYSTAFGTGKHETTQMCLEFISSLKEKVEIKNALDVGTGSGILAILIEKIFNKAKIDASDIDEKAVSKALEFVEINNCSNINLIVSDGFNNYLKNKKYDVIVSNILKEPLIQMKSDFKKSLNKSGYIILSGFLKSQLNDIINGFEQEELQLISVKEQNNWCSVLMKNKI